MTISVRRATVDDARAIATVRVVAWRAAYAGLIPDQVLDALDVDVETASRAGSWNERHTDPRRADFIAESGGRVAGWAAVGPGEEGGPVGAGQVYAMYALPTHWGRGVGHALLEAAESFLRDAGFTHGALWYLAGNERAGAFYERHGWVEDGGEQFDERLIGGLDVPALHERRRVKRPL